ncbi:hypothetical protein GCM10011609_58740 [Lentzea pudingi]|uniref:Phosphotransferase enzyme family protein n=1 Tax=Lentzea pudingi TaxID=1789439 RepID=A0ABQ2IJD9_9PSEU|nr:hypothetical protein [Lentzea pudingi]GGN11039.1 hypothetical protein GCM10011609_58740 [Lentzea pudingi]
MVPVAFDPVALTTAAVYRVVSAGESTFVKVLRRPHVPERFEDVVREFPWRDEAEFRAVVGELPWRDEAEFLLSDFVLPPGMRRPHVLRVDDFGDRIALWLEDVRCADVEWDLPRFRRAALGLGRWAGRHFGGAPGRALRTRAGGGHRRLLRRAVPGKPCCVKGRGRAGV